jgi:hypothetical protein
MMPASTRAHTSPEGAFNCHARHLVNDKGYEQIGPREFREPNGGPIRVLTKKSRFGGVLRGGKRGETGGGGSTANRYNAKAPYGRRTKAGVISSY